MKTEATWTLLAYGPLSIFIVVSFLHTRQVIWRLRDEVHRTRMLDEQLHHVVQELHLLQTERLTTGANNVFMGTKTTSAYGIYIPGPDRGAGSGAAKSQLARKALPEHVDFDADQADLGLIEPFFHRKKLYWRKSTAGQLTPGKAPRIPTKSTRSAGPR